MKYLYVITRRDLDPGYQAVQSIHAAIEFAMEHKEVTAGWFEKSNYLALLSTSDEKSLQKLANKARDRGIRVSEFREPDIGDQLTAIALEPGEMSMRICRGLPLALG